MKKIFTSILVAMLFLGVSANGAEKNGAFMGINVGIPYNSMGKLNYTVDSIDTYGDFAFGALVGYKQFFTENFGLRYYANVSYYMMSASSILYSITHTNLLNYTANVDMLFNFKFKDGSWGGLFLGVGVGGNTWSGDLVDYVVNIVQQYGVKTKKTGLDVHLNVGIRGTFGEFDNHSIEGVFIVSFINTTFYSEYGAYVKARQIFSYIIRYTYNF